MPKVRSRWLAINFLLTMADELRRDRMAQDKPVTLGYFTVTQDARVGWTGGLLVLNNTGRPLEFQCTLPVRPSRAHEILFGPTLRAHVIAEVIGKLLLQKCRTSISLLCCDQPESLTLDSYTQAPIALIKEAAESEEGPITSDMLQGFGTVEIAQSDLYVPIEKLSVVQSMADSFQDFPDAVEPLDRIREAIFEAHSQLARQKPSQAA